MSFAIRFSVAARSDQQRLLDFIREKSPDAAAHAYSVLLGAFDQLMEFPLSGRSVGSSRICVARFGQGGYVIKYRVYGDVVVVSRIFHLRENWRG
ncbi:type II toxin-antitoxin system RelE/ParE family toxin [Brevundimonas sp.]|uniref:type II toxin-antitoxin system RelE/ParE family toxin n=1 Tax=Brevundimonas sp. TaxID=1871086 RepID=UPI0037C123D6